MRYSRCGLTGARATRAAGQSHRKKNIPSNSSKTAFNQCHQHLQSFLPLLSPLPTSAISSSSRSLHHGLRRQHSHAAAPLLPNRDQPGRVPGERLGRADAGGAFLRRVGSYFRRDDLRRAPHQPAPQRMGHGGCDVVCAL